MKGFLRNQDGSASVEFVALAIPLFIPLFFYLNQFANLSGEEEMARTLAREGARAYVASSGSNTAEVMMNRVIMAAGEELGLTSAQFSRLAIGLECSASPCHSPNGRVQVTVHFSATSEFRAVTASAQEYISPWT
jgi:Flp pilus assembly protein TadG